MADPTWDETTPIDPPAESPPTWDETTPIDEPTQKEPDTKAMKDFVDKNLKVYQASKEFKDKNPEQHYATGWWDAFKGGLQSSATGMWVRGEMPDTVIPEYTSRAMSLANSVGAWAGDLPLMAASGVFGGAVGASVGGVPLHRQ